MPISWLTRVKVAVIIAIYKFFPYQIRVRDALLSLARLTLRGDQSREYSHDPSNPPQWAIRSAGNRQVERVGHDVVTVSDQASALTEVLEYQGRVNEAEEGDPDGRCGELTEVCTEDSTWRLAMTARHR